MKQLMALLLLSLFLAGCGSMVFSKYTGKSSRWPVQIGTIAETQFSIPVYRGWPERPYEVIGSIRYTHQKYRWKDDKIAGAATLAKARGADAIIIRRGGEVGVGKIIGATEDPTLVSSSESTALAIRWIPGATLAGEQELYEETLRRLRTQRPDLACNEEVIRLAYDLIALDSPATADRRCEQMASLIAATAHRAKTDPSGKWLFRGIVRRANLTSQTTDTVVGLATVSVEKGAVAILSNRGNTELSLTGLYDRGRVSGQIGLQRMSAKCNGVILEDKMSITFQGFAPGGTVQGEVVFVR